MREYGPVHTQPVALAVELQAQFMRQEAICFSWKETAVNDTTEAWRRFSTFAEACSNRLSFRAEQEK